MILAAIVIGLITAYYLGLKAGGIAAAGSMLLFVIAQVVPGATMWAYAIVAVGLLALFAFGPKLQKRSPESEQARRLFRLARRAARQVYDRADRQRRERRR